MPTTTIEHDVLDDDFLTGGGTPITEFIGPYRKLGLLGKGGMSEVYRVRDERLDREYALKLIRPSPFSNADDRAKIEITILKKLKHDNIVRLLDEGISNDGQTYFTMELVEGMSLAELLADGNSPFSTIQELLSPLSPTPMLGGPMGDLSLQAPAYIGAIRIVQQIAMALTYLHGQQIIHRDIKPSNILLKPNGRAMLTDFGIAHYPRQSVVMELTKPGDFIGTLRYAAPEQNVGEAVDQRTDVYSLGAVLYELVCGVPLFNTIENPNALTTAINAFPPRSPIVHAPQIPQELNEIILKAISKKPDQRFSSALEFATVLQRILKPSQLTEIEKTERTASHILAVSLLVGSAMALTAAVTPYLSVKFAQLNWQHPAFPSLAFFAVAVALGFTIAGLLYGWCLLRIAIHRLWTRLWGNRRATY